MKQLAMLAVFAAATASGQANAPLSVPQLRDLAARCAPRVHPDTIQALTQQESSRHPFALSVNYPKTEGNRQGHPHTFYELARQPRDKAEAISWTRWFITHGHTVSIGLMQVSSEQARRLGITDLRALFEPCVNLSTGATLLEQTYRGKSHDLRGLADAFALYNAGSITLGTQNGYAGGVIAKAPPLTTR